MWLKRLVIVTVLTIMSPSFVMAVNPLTNWQFVSDISGWTEGTNNRVTATWDASGYANGGDAKFDLTSSGRTNQIEYLQQNINITSIPTSVYLSLAWKKTYTGDAPSYADVFVTIVKPDTTTVDLWSNTSFDISTSADGPWTNKCSGVAGASPRQCVITGLNPETDYYIRITHTDPDGVVGTNPQVIGPYTTLPPSDTTPPVFSGIQLVYDFASGGSVTLEFNSATDPSPPIRYNVYFKESAIWSWTTATKLSNVYVTSGSTHTYKYTVTGLQDGVQYTFGVRAEDRYGNEETNTVTLTAIPTDRTLRAGWNLICDSRILDPAYTSPRQVFGDDLYPFAVSMYRWRSTGLSETSGYFIPVSQIQNGLGYWIYGYRNHVIDDWGVGTDEGSATSTENTAPTTSIPLQYGWNMIGNPYKLRVRLQDCQVRRNSESPVSFATAVSNGWIGNSIYFWTYGNTYIGEAFNELDPNKGNLKPWVGVWIQVIEGTNTLYFNCSETMRRNEMKLSLKILFVITILNYPAFSNPFWEIEFTVSKGHAYNRLIIGIANDATDDFDRQYEMRALLESSQPI